jgi:hypothetical protein
MSFEVTGQKLILVPDRWSVKGWKYSIAHEDAPAYFKPRIIENTRGPNQSLNIDPQLKEVYPCRWSETGWRYGSAPPKYLKHVNKRNIYPIRSPDSPTNDSTKFFVTTNQHFYSPPKTCPVTHAARATPKEVNWFPPLPHGTQKIKKYLEANKPNTSGFNEMYNSSNEFGVTTLAGILGGTRTSKNQDFKSWAGTTVRDGHKTFNKKKTVTTEWQESIISKGTKS